MNTIKQIKLVTGEEIICEVLDANFEVEKLVDDTHIIRMPLAIKLVLKKEYRFYQLYPWLAQTADDSIVAIKSSTVVAYCTPSDELIHQYTVFKETEAAWEKIEAEKLESLMELENFFDSESYGSMH
jgi:hypothetical protein